MTDKPAIVLPSLSHLPVLLLPVLLVRGVLPVMAADATSSWNKDPGQWTDQDAQLVLTASPWSQSASAVMADPRDEIEPSPTPAPAAERSGLAGSNNPTGTATSGGGRWDGSVGRNRMGRLPSVPVLVRWDSALPVREALRRTAGAGEAEKNGGSSSDYVVSLSGLIPGGRYRSSGRTETASRSDGGVDARNPEEILEAFMSYSRLLPSGAAAIVPSNVKLDAATGAVQIFFPRTHPIEAGAKEVVFLTRFGGLTVRAKFRVKEMKYQGKLEL
jgi:hypothetical protein